MSNLLSNAIKYTNTGGITLRVKLKDESLKHPGVLIIKVSDTGIGIVPEDQDKVFEPFSQLKDPRRNYLRISHGWQSSKIKIPLNFQLSAFSTSEASIHYRFDGQCL